MGSGNLKGTTGGWSKHGGPRSNAKKEKLTGDWVCQSCGKNFSMNIKPFIYEYLIEEYIRICATCCNDDCAVLRKRLKTDYSGQ